MVPLRMHEDVTHQTVRQFPVPLDVALPVVLVGLVVFVAVAYYLVRNDVPYS